MEPLYSVLTVSICSLWLEHTFSQPTDNNYHWIIYYVTARPTQFSKPTNGSRRTLNLLLRDNCEIYAIIYDVYISNCRLITEPNKMYLNISIKIINASFSTALVHLHI
jgi:hypothetical protein